MSIVTQDWFRKRFRFNQYERDQWIKGVVKEIPDNSRVLDFGGAGPYGELIASIKGTRLHSLN